MKNILQTIKLRRLKTEFTKDSLKQFEGHDFYVLYKDETWEWAIGKEDLARILKNDHIKPIYYIFDATDRIIVDRNVRIDVNNI